MDYQNFFNRCAAASIITIMALAGLGISVSFLVGLNEWDTIAFSLSAITAVLLAGLGGWMWSIIKDADHRFWTNKKEVTK